MNLRYQPKKLTYQDFVTAMGLSTGNAMNPPAPATANWPYRGYIGFGTRLHGDAVPKYYADIVKALPGYPSGANAGLLTTPWEGITPWIGFMPDAANTCTNAVLKVYDLQCQYFDKNTLKWTVLSDPTNRFFPDLVWFLTNNYNRDSICDRIYIGRNPLARFSSVKNPADRSTPSSDTSKYRICHYGNQLIPLDYSVLGGLFVSVRARVEPISGSFNATPRFLLSVGADGNPRTAPGNGTQQGILTGLDSLPAIGGTGPMLMLMPTDGSEATFIFASAKINPNTYQDNTSDYAIANGVDAMVQDAAQFAVNLPQIMSF